MRPPSYMPSEKPCLANGFSIKADLQRSTRVATNPPATHSLPAVSVAPNLAISRAENMKPRHHKGKSNGKSQYLDYIRCTSDPIVWRRCSVW